MKCNKDNKMAQQMYIIEFPTRENQLLEWARQMTKYGWGSISGPMGKPIATHTGQGVTNPQFQLHRTPMKL